MMIVVMYLHRFRFSLLIFVFIYMTIYNFKMLQTSFILNEIGTKCKSKLIPVAKIHTACLILTNFDIKKLLSFLNIKVTSLAQEITFLV